MTPDALAGRAVAAAEAWVYVQARTFLVEGLGVLVLAATQRKAAELLTDVLGRRPEACSETIGVVAGHLYTDGPRAGKFGPTPWPEATVVRVTVRLVEEPHL